MLADSVRAVLSGQGRLLLVHGDPGIGKTRLAAEIAAHAAESGARVLWGRCWEGGGAPAYWPWIQALRSSLASGICSHEMLTEPRRGLVQIAQIVPELLDMLPLQEPIPASLASLPLADAPGRPPERFRLFDAVTNLFKRMAADAPLLLVLDDLHAADEDSLMLLRFLARELTQERILVVGTFRDLEVKQSNPHATLLAEIGREGIDVPLRGFTLPEINDFVGSMASVPVPAALVSSLQHVTEGNPLFLEGIVRLMLADRELGRGDATRADFAIPDSIRTTIDRRLQKLSAATRGVLTTASVIGNEFDVPLLTALSGLTGNELLEHLGEAAACAVVVEPARGLEPYRFSHAIVGEVLRTGLSRAERANLHRRIAAAIEQLHQHDPTPYLGQLAHHYFEALSIDTAGKAIEYARRGAERARSQLAFAEAVRLYGMALRALDVGADHDRVQTCEILLAMGEAQAQGGNLDDARSTFERAADVGRQLGDPSLLARAALRAGAWFGTFFTLDRALHALVEEALQALGEGDSALRASLLAILASERYWAGEHDSGTELSERAVAMARRVGDRHALVAALWVANQIRWGPDDVEGRLASATEIATLAESIGDLPRALRAHEMRFTALLEKGDMTGVRALIQVYDALARRAGEDFGIVERFQAAEALLCGDFERAEMQIQALSRNAERRQDPALLACVQALSAALWEEQGRLEPARLGAATSALMAQSPALAAHFRVISALLQLLAGRQDEPAAELAALTRDRCAAIPRDWNWLDSMRGLAILCLALRDREHAAIVYEQLAPYADHNITTGWGDVARGSAALYLGSLARLLGRLDDAEVHLDLALARNQSMGARPALARTKFEAARTAMARNAPGDRDRALRLFRAALATASELGMEPLQQRARAALERMGVRDAPAAETPGESGIEALAASVIAEPDALCAHAGPEETRTILFTDIERATALYDTLGDLRAQEILAAHNTIVRRQVAEFGGVEVKSLGDGFLIVFSSARRALRCAIQIQRALAAYSAEPGRAAIRVRMGLHVGELLTLQSDIAGKAVIVAARIAQLPRGGEILASSTLFELTESAGDVKFEEYGDIELKGLSGTYRLYRVLW